MRRHQLGGGSSADSLPATAGPTPVAQLECRDGRPVPFGPDRDAWSHPTWKALGFHLEKPTYYRYEFVSDSGPSAKFTARATGDLDCDGVRSTFEFVGFVDEKGMVRGAAGMYFKDRLD